VAAGAINEPAAAAVGEGGRDGVKRRKCASGRALGGGTTLAHEVSRQEGRLQMKHSILATLSALATSALVMAPDQAGAATYSGDGWLQLVKSSSKSASTTIAGNDFGVGYSAYFGLAGYDWDVASNTITTVCSTYIVFSFPAIKTVSEGDCASLPGTQLSASVSIETTSYGGDPAQKTTLTAVWDVQDTGAMARVEGYFRVPVTLFDEDLDLFKLTAAASGKSYAGDSISADIYVLGSKIYGGAATLPASVRLVEECMTLAEVDAQFSLMGIPITVSASSDGCVYVDASASWSNRTLSGSVTPGASVDATVKAGVGGDGGFASASAGVYGNIVVVDASLPLTISAAVGTSGITVTESAKLTMTGLDGEVGLYAEGCLFGICEEASKMIFDWTGMTYASATIFSASQTLPY
jgi:hypothetical protein